MAQSIDRLVHIVDRIPVVHSFLESRRLKAQSERDSYVAVAFAPLPLTESARESYKRRRMEHVFSLYTKTRNSLPDPDYVSAATSLGVSAMHEERDRLNGLTTNQLDQEIQASAHTWIRNNPLKAR